MHEIRIFTVPLLEGLKIKDYKGIVIARNVRAINIVRDILTSFRDIFGGRSESYQGVMKAMQDEVIAEAKEQAFNMGANAIIGFSLDYENVGSKSMLMAAARGTAVIVE